MRPAVGLVAVGSQVTVLRLTLLLAAFWPLYGWYAGRLGDGSEEPWALALLPLVACLGRPPERLDLRWTASLLVLYALSYPFAPSLVRAGLAALALAAFLSAWRQERGLDLGLAGLLVLSLPALTTLSFYLGYPMRAFCASVAALLLGVQAEGAALRFEGGLVSVDAPCSGLRMLWVGLLLVFLLGVLRRWSLRTTLVWTSLTGLLLLVGNIARISSLFFLETGLVQAPGWFHEGVGVVVFAGVALAVARWAPATSVAVKPRTLERGGRAFLLAACLAAGAPFLPGPAEKTMTVDFPGWWTSFEGRPLRELAVSNDEKRFFPGYVGRFSDGRREIVLRFFGERTRKLHSSADCLRGLGYQVTPLPLVRGPEGELWSAFEATRGNERLRLRERIFGPEGSWPDVSQWYWNAGDGPWWAVTVCEGKAH